LFSNPNDLFAKENKNLNILDVFTFK